MCKQLQSSSNLFIDYIITISHMKKNSLAAALLECTIVLASWQSVVKQLVLNMILLCKRDSSD